MFRDRLRQLRKEFDLTQEQLALEIKTTRGIIVNLENGRAQPTVKILVKLSMFFKTSIDYLLGLSEVRNYQNQTEITKAFSQLGDYEVKLVMALIDKMIELKGSSSTDD